MKANKWALEHAIVNVVDPAAEPASAAAAAEEPVAE